MAIAVLRLAREAGVTTVLDPAPVPAMALSADDWSLVDVATPNRLECAALTGGNPDDDPQILADRLRLHFAGVIVLTLAADGVLVDDRETTVRLLVVAADHVLDTSGAGDAFAGALAMAFGGAAPHDRGGWFRRGCRRPCG